jgi:hypothetical protein
VLVLLGIGTRAMGLLSGLLLLIYIAGVAQSAARGLHIDCGCFGGGGQLAAGQQTQYAPEILRDTGFLLMAAWLFVRPRTMFSVDGWLLGRQPAIDDDEGEFDEPTEDGPSHSAVGSA